MANKTIGVLLPIRRGRVGYFDSSLELLDQVKTNLINLIMTQKGERVYQPDFGTDLHKLVFEQMDDEYNDRVESAIRVAAAKWMPFLRIDEILVSRNEDENSTAVKVTFSLRSNVEVTASIVVTF